MYRNFFRDRAGGSHKKRFSIEKDNEGALFLIIGYNMNMKFILLILLIVAGFYLYAVINLRMGYRKLL
jgi:hypothetical protein